LALFPSKPIRTALLSFAALLLAPLAGAEPLSQPAQPWLTGDWNGFRTRLFERGLDLQLVHVSELAYNAAGGSRTLATYTDQVALGATFDLERLFGLHDARFQVTYTERAGRNLVDDAQLGTLQLVQEVYGRGQTVRLTEMWFEQGYFGNTLSWKWGRLPVGGDFAAFPCDFQNLTFCGSQPGNLVGNYIFNWPISQWGTRLKARLGAAYLQAGVYDQNDQYLGYDNKLLPVFYQGSTGALVPVEVGWLPALAGGRLPGSYRIGAWYSSSVANDAVLDVTGGLAGLSGLPPAHRQGRYGGYLTFQQQMTRNDSPNPNGGLRMFFNAVFADAATSTLDRQLVVGAWYTGPFASRPNDVIAFAAGTTHINSRIVEEAILQNAQGLGPLSEKSAEYVLELDYTFVPVPGFLVRPNLQYIASPGAGSTTRDVFVLGLKTIISF
jgi:porin